MTTQGRVSPGELHLGAASGRTALFMTSQGSVSDSRFVEMQVRNGRHPVIESTSREPFVPNDLRLDEDHFLIVLTGPNMGGKSTYLRQTAILTIMAQMGSFVPADEARIGLVDRILAARCPRFGTSCLRKGLAGGPRESNIALIGGPRGPAA